MSLFRKGILAGGGSVLCTGLGLITNMILARILLPEGMGKYQIPFTGSVLFITILGLGIGQANIYFLNKHKIDPQQIVMNGLWTGGFALVIILLFLPLLFSVFEGYFGVLPLWIQIILSLGSAAVYLSNLLRPVLVADMRIREYVYAHVANKVACLITIVIIIVMGMVSVESALLSVAMGYFADAAFNLYYVRHQINHSYHFSFKLFKDVFRYGLHIFAANVVYLINVQIGLMLLRYLMPDDFSSVGYYGRAVAIGNMIMLLPAAVGPLLYARWSEVSGEQRSAQASLAMRMHIAMGIILIMILVPAAPLVITLLFGKAYLPAVAVMRVMVFAVAFRCTFTVCLSLLTGDGRAHITTYIIGGSVILIVLLTFLLVPHMGMMGAAVADVTASLGVMAAGFVILKRDYGILLQKSILLNKSDVRYLISSLRKRRIDPVTV